jgi:signal transduction histidine kinase
MEDIIDDALDLAREDDAVTITDRVGVSSVARSAWTNVETHTASLAFDDECSIEADRDKLLTLFENLFRNAVEHAGSDVTVTVGSLDSRTGFYVADDGPGIPESERTEVFQHGHTTSSDGTGLGLSIVTRIADAHGWEVTVRESRSGGARFEIVVLESSGDQS